jgi:hypothetical protein
MIAQAKATLRRGQAISGRLFLAARTKAAIEPMSTNQEQSTNHRKNDLLGHGIMKNSRP